MTAETLTINDVVAQLDEMYEHVTRDETHPGEWEPKPEETMREAFAALLERTAGAQDRVWCVNAGPDDDTIIVALTGNGPRSAANARFLSHVLNNWPAISDAIRVGQMSSADIIPTQSAGSPDARSDRKATQKPTEETNG